MAAAYGESKTAAATVGVVLPGGGARGAYEVGALSVLLPALQARGERVSVWCGTSVGAINAALLASLADEPVAERVEHAIALWLLTTPPTGGRESSASRRRSAPSSVRPRAGLP